MQARATVIIPTYGNALFARWAIQSVQRQTVKEIEICIICDGSPEPMVSFFNTLAEEDSRIRVYSHPKSPRTGEPYRDRVIKETTGKIICYCSHDDLWLPGHIEAIEKTLRNCCFTHSIHAIVNLPENIKNDDMILGCVNWIDLKNPRTIKQMHDWRNFHCIGLTYGAHTRQCYNELKEGWVTTPIKEFPTDLYMWLKFVSAFEKHCQTTKKVTALNFQKIPRKDWSEQARDDELRDYFQRIEDPAFLRKIEEQAFLFCPLSFLPFLKMKLYCYSKIRKLTQIYLPRRA